MEDKNVNLEKRIGDIEEGKNQIKREIEDVMKELENKPQDDPCNIKTQCENQIKEALE